MAENLMVPPGFEYSSTSSDSEPELNQYIVKPSEAITKSGLKIEPQDLPSSSSDGSDSDEHGTGSDYDSDGPDSKLSAISGEARDDPKKFDGGDGKNGTSDTAAGEKRAEDGKALEAKRSKEKRAQFERLFSEEDEVALLNGMIRFAEKNKSAPFADLDAFRDFVKADLNVDPTKDQLKHKMRKFKTKYDKNMRKQASGSARSLKAHERRAFELSKLVWANEYIKGQKMVRSPKAAGKKRAKAEKAADVADIGGGASEASACKKRAKAEKAADVADNGGGASEVSAGKKRAKAEKAADVTDNGGGASEVSVGKKRAKAEKAADVMDNGGGASEVSAGKKRAKPKKVVDLKEKGGDACNVSVVAEILSLSDMSVSRIGAQLLEGGRGVEGEDEWNELKKAEMEVYLKKVQLMRTKTRLILDILKAN